MKKLFLRFLTLVSLFVFGSTTAFSQGANCASADPFCTGTTYTFPNTTNNGDLGPINCLGSSPNPAWYYMEIDQNGPMSIQIDQTSSGGSGLDVDFALFGPYPSLAAACATIPGGNVVDCSYSAAASETANIPNAVVGEVYVLLLTNFSNQPGNITFNQSGGTGSADCSLLCGVTGFTANPTPCVPATNTYDVSGTLSITNPPSSGTLTITNSCGGTQIFNAPFSTSINYSFTGITANGAGCTVSAVWSADPNCNVNVVYTAPAPCIVPGCFMTNINANIGACIPATNTYDASGSISFTNPPLTGQLIIQTCGGNQQVFNPPFASPTNFNITGIPADGTTNCNVTAFFTADPACTIQVGPYTEPVCTCNMDTLNIVINPCDPATNNFFIDVHLVFTSAPSSGQLIIQNCSGDQVVLNAPFTSPVDVSILGINSDATANCTVTAFFTADPACTITSPTFTEPANCVCPADAGLSNAVLTGNSNTNFILCENDQIDITQSGFTFPNDVGTINGNPYQPGIGFLIYSCPPTPGMDPVSDPCFEGAINPASSSFFDINDPLSWFAAFPAGTFTNNTIYFVPFTYYTAPNLVYNVNCWDMGTPTAVTYLPPIVANGVENCAAGTVTVTVSGGYPGLMGGNFTASNLLPANAVFNNTTCANNGTIVISGLQDGQNYSFTITDGNGCPYNFTGGPFNGPDVPVINPAGPFCLSDPSVNLTSTFPGGTWSGNGITNPSSGTFDPATAGIGAHQIIYVAPGCGSSDTIQIVVNATYDATIAPAGPYCADAAPVILSAADPGGTWSGTGITNAATGEFSPSVAGSGTFVITYTISGSCGDSQTTNITVNPVADATINPAGPFCDVDPAINLSAATAGGTWSGPGITNQSNGTFDPGVAGLGTHAITYMISSACGDTATINIVVNNQFDATINPAGPFCASNPNTFLVATDPGGTWSGNGIVNATTGEFSPTIAGAGTHTITYTIAGACGDSQTTTIQVIADADATINPAGPFCITDPATNMTALQPGGTWSGTGITNPASGTFNPATAGVGTHVITYSISGVCGDLQTTNVIVTDTIATTITPAGPFCENAPATNLTGANPGGTWSGNGITDPAAGTFDPSVAGPGTHIITYTISGNCGTSSSTTIVVNPLPQVSFTVDNPSGCVPLTATVTNTSNPVGTSVQWSIDGSPFSTNVPDFTNTFLIPGCHDVALQVTDANGCSSSLTMPSFICAYAIPNADFTFSPNNATVLNPIVNFINESTGASTYLWDFSGLGSSTATNPSFNFPNTQGSNYTVCLTATSANGCEDSICKIITIYDEFIVYVPNAFTPDNDGINDYFMPVVSGHDPLAYEFWIFDRWGELIYESYSNQDHWDGTHKGAEVKQDVYVWKLKVKRLSDGKKFEYYGHVSVLK